MDKLILNFSGDCVFPLSDQDKTLKLFPGPMPLDPLWSAN